MVGRGERGPTTGMTHELQRTPEGVPDADLPVWELVSLSALKWSGIPPGCKRTVAR